MAEEWKNIDWYSFCKNDYAVSTEGRVKRLEGWAYTADGKKHKYVKENILEDFEHAKYRCVKLCGKGKEETVYVHRLVATAFIPNPKNKPEVNHKDGNQTNNKASNLEWVDRQENVDKDQDKQKTMTFSQVYGYRRY